MYLFGSSFVKKEQFNRSVMDNWQKNINLIADLSVNQMVRATHHVGPFILSLWFVLPKHHPLIYKEDLSGGLSFYLFGDPGPYSVVELCRQVVMAYQRGHFIKLTQLTMLYNLILIDHKLDKLFFFCDSYQCQIAFYSQYNTEYLISNSLKGMVTHPNAEPSLDYDEFINTLLLGNQFPEKTLISDVKRLRPNYYLAYPEGSSHKLPTLETEKDPGLSMVDCVETIHQLSLDALRPWVEKNQVGLLFSGGNDSTSVAQLLQKQRGNQSFNYTYLTGSHDMNRDNVLCAKTMLGLSTHFLNYPIDTIANQQERSIWHGESDMVGLNALNVSLETTLTNTISNHCSAWTVGDYFQIPLKLNLYDSTNSMFDKLRRVFSNGILNKKELSTLFVISLKLPQKLLHLTESLALLSGAEAFSEFTLAIYPASLYRLRNRINNFSATNFYLSRDQSLSNFINTIPRNLIQQITHNHQGKITVLFHEILKKILGAFYERGAKKSWMEAFVNLDKENVVKKEIQHYLRHESSLMKTLFGDKINGILEAQSFVKRYDNLLFSLWSLDIFYRQFIVGKGRHPPQ